MRSPIKALVERAEQGFPSGLRYAYAFDTTAFIRLSIEEVQKTLIEAIVLVVIVMFVFLQSWRATLVPAIAVPVVLLGTLAILYVAGFTINTLTLFGLVLSIGLLVDDAIVVVENVERLLEENPDMSPREATIASMDQIQVALVAIALVLSAVFIPMAFFGGSTGVIYRQFSVTIITAVGLVALNPVYVEVYRTVVGQVVLAGIVSAWGVALWWLSSMSQFQQPERFLIAVTHPGGAR